MKDAIGLVPRVMSKTMDSTTLRSEKVSVLSSPPLLHALICYCFAAEFAVLVLDPDTKRPNAKIYKPAEINTLLAKGRLGKKEEDT